MQGGNGEITAVTEWNWYILPLWKITIAGKAFTLNLCAADRPWVKTSRIHYSERAAMPAHRT